MQGEICERPKISRMECETYEVYGIRQQYCGKLLGSSEEYTPASSAKIIKRAVKKESLTSGQTLLYSEYQSLLSEPSTLTILCLTISLMAVRPAPR